MKVLSVMLMVIFSSIATAEIAIIVHPNNNNALDVKTAARIFTGKLKTFPGGESAVPIAQNDDSNTTKEFNKKVLKKSGSQLKAYWSKLVFTGKGTPPKKVGSDNEVIDLISVNPNFIGYVSADSVVESVKVIAKL